MININNNRKDDILISVLEVSSNYLQAQMSKNKNISQKELESFIESLYKFCINISNNKEDTQQRYKETVFNDYIICLEDGAHVVLLKPYLARKFNMTPEAYRIKWNLSHDYPMTAPNYKKKRSYFAKKNKLGKKFETVTKVKSK